MNTKSALIVAVAIVIGFSIEPILDRDVSDDLKNEIVELKMPSKPSFYGVAGEYDWQVNDNTGFVEAVRKNGTRLFPANKISAEIGLKMVKYSLPPTMDPSLQRIIDESKKD